MSSSRRPKAKTVEELEAERKKLNNRIKKAKQREQEAQKKEILDAVYTWADAYSIPEDLIAYKLNKYAEKKRESRRTETETEVNYEL